MVQLRRYIYFSHKFNWKMEKNLFFGKDFMKKEKVGNELC
jgi:hypothetical protein